MGGFRFRVRRFVAFGRVPCLFQDFWGAAPDPANLIKDQSSAVCGLMARLL
ncbi:hypothetical protein LX86_009389, partial [Lentzea aerocolonigenes]|nr:hypothetical protein [Lentzea aerocolonigenes]